MEIKLNGKNGGVALVSQEDYELVSKYKWYLSGGYVMGEINGKLTLMHRFIMKPDATQHVDHINGKKYDNSRENLRNTTPQKNNENKKKQANSSSKYFGVRVKRNKYEASIAHNKKRQWLGTFDNEIVAAEIRDIYIVQNKLDHIELNFPDKKDAYAKSEHVFSKYTKDCPYIGVFWEKDRSKFAASVIVNSKKIHILTSPSEYDCAIAHDEYIVKHNILDKELNFPEKYNYETRSIKTFYEPIDEKTIRLIIKSAPDKIVKIDIGDYDLIKYYNCIINNNYVKVSTENGQKPLHRIIMNVSQTNIFVDHIDNDPLNNTRSNLRLSNHQHNAQNKIKRTGLTSKYSGCCYYKDRKKWCSSIYLNYKLIFNYYNISEEFTVRNRDLYIMDNLQDTGFKLNFEWTPEEITTWRKILTQINKYSQNI